MTNKTILLCGVAVGIFLNQNFAQEFSTPQLKKASTEISKLIRDGELQAAKDRIAESTVAPIEPLDEILLETMRLKIARERSIARDYENAQIDFLQTIKFMSTHLEYPLAQTYCVAAFEGFNNLVRIGKAKQFLDELTVYSVNSILEQEAKGETTATSQRAGRLAASYADTTGNAELRAELLAVIDRQLQRLHEAYEREPSATTALALASFQNAKAKFHSANDADRFDELSMKQESFLIEALTAFPDSYELSHELSKITVLRVTRIGRSHPSSAKTSVKHTLEAITAAQETLGNRVNHQIQTIKRVASSLPESP